jgi:hypothetical protein
MATIETVIAKQIEALDEAYTVAGQPTLSQQMAAKDAQIAQLQSSLAAVSADLATANAKLSAGLSAAQATVTALS